MECPIRPPVKDQDRYGFAQYDYQCIKEECAWYDDEYERCSMLSIARTLRGRE